MTLNLTSHSMFLQISWHGWWVELPALRMGSTLPEGAGTGCALGILLTLHPANTMKGVHQFSSPVLPAQRSYPLVCAYSKPIRRKVGLEYAQTNG